MKKNILQDIIPPKKTIRNVELPSKSRRTESKVTKDEIKIPIHKKEESIPKPFFSSKQPEKKELLIEVKPDLSYKYEFDEPRKSSKKVLYTIAGVFLLALVFGVSVLFKSAEIKITPKQEIKALSEVFTAKKDATTGLGFQLVTITKDVERIVKSTSEEEVQKKAQGRIIIYNNYGPQSQKLIATTRFETEEGLVYMLLKDVIVPGRVVKDGKTVAGSIEVTVEASKPGVDYNIGLKDFTVPGFKGDPKYTKFYARSKTPMVGGFSGMQKVVSGEVMNKTAVELEEELEALLYRDITSQIPSNFVLYKDSMSFSFDPINQVNNTTGEAVLRKKGKASAIIFDKGSLSRIIISKILSEASGDLVKIINLDKLGFNYSDSSSFDPDKDTSVTFELKGEPNFVWVFDENKMKTDILGLSKKNAETVARSYSNIKEVLIKTSPFWSKAIPKDPNKVNLINTLTK